MATGDLVRVETEIGHFVLRSWVTEGIRPGVVACSHHMGRWKPDQPTGIGGEAVGQGQMMATVALDRRTGGWAMRRLAGVAPYVSPDPDTQRIWWSDVGVHQNLTRPLPRPRRPHWLLRPVKPARDAYQLAPSLTRTP